MSKDLVHLTIEVSEGMVKDLREGWRELKLGDMKDLTFNDYAVACIMYGHWNTHKALGMLAIMVQKSENNRKAKKE